MPRRHRDTLLPTHDRRRDRDYEKERRKRESRERSFTAVARCRKVIYANRKQCFIGLLLCSVLAVWNLFQLAGFVFSRKRPTEGVSRIQQARSSLRSALAGALGSAKPLDVSGHRSSYHHQQHGALSSPAASWQPSSALQASLTDGSISDGGTTIPLLPPLHRRSDGDLKGPAVTASSLAPAPVPPRHPQYRIAFTVPWIGRTFPSWFPYFLSSCRRSEFIADWLIFHEGAQMPRADEIPPNVLFFDLGKEGLGALFGAKIADALGLTEFASKLIQLFRIAFREFAYIVTEYKPTHGTVFADYLSAYTHWSYTDIDMLIGDLPLHIELDELANYDIFTYHFGDVFRLYLRGQFAAHRNSPKVNLLWAECPHLGSGLVRELEAKWHIVRRLAQEGKHGRTRFISAEGCYSWVVASTDHNLRVKFASKAFADWSDDKEFYVVDGAVRKCPKVGQIWDPRSGSTGNDNDDGGRGSDKASEDKCMPFGPRIARHSVSMGGVQHSVGVPRPLALHADCSRWVEERYRLCADLSEEEAPLYNVVLSNGSWTASRFANIEPRHALEGAFLHLQRWKGEYKRLAYGERGMPRLDGRRVFRLSRFGFGVYDGTYDDDRGVAVAEPADSSGQKDVTEMTDDEFELQLGALRTAVRERGGVRHKDTGGAVSTSKGSRPSWVADAAARTARDAISYHGRGGAGDALEEEAHGIGI